VEQVIAVSGSHHCEPLRLQFESFAVGVCVLLVQDEKAFNRRASLSNPVGQVGAEDHLP